MTTGRLAGKVAIITAASTGPGPMMATLLVQSIVVDAGGVMLG
ncbi:MULTISPECIES: hypothetical protein [unclassified Frankia]|nr:MULTISPECIES: hypothetical protein [unclassified Frankia]